MRTVGFANLCLLAVPALAADWPMFHGTPDLAGVARVDGTAPLDRLELAWHFKTGGPVKSSAAIAGGRVFVGSNDASLYAIDLATGNRLWTYKTGDDIESSPLVLGDTVYVGSADASLYALDTATGALKWSYKTGDKILGSPNSFRTAEGDRIVIGSYDNHIHCLDAATGKPIWTYDTENYINGAPAIAEGRIVFGGCDAKIHVLSTHGELLKSIDAGSYIAGSCAVRGHRAWAGHYGNEVLCADLETGEILWTNKTSNDPYFSTPALTEKHLLIGGRDKKIHCLDQETGKEIWSVSTGGPVDASPVVVGNAAVATSPIAANRVVAASNDGKLRLLDLNDGKELWVYDIGKPILSSPAVAEKHILIGSNDGSVYAFQMP